MGSWDHVSGDSQSLVSTEPLLIGVDTSEREVVLRLVGDLDPHTVSALDQAIVDVTASPVMRIVLDLERVDFIDSAGLRSIITANQGQAARGGELWLRAPSPTVRRLLEITGLDDHLAIEGDR